MRLTEYSSRTRGSQYFQGDFVDSHFRATALSSHTSRRLSVLLITISSTNWWASIWSGVGVRKTKRACYSWMNAPLYICSDTIVGSTNMKEE